MFSTNFSKTCRIFAQKCLFGKLQDGGLEGGHVVKRLLP